MEQPKNWGGKREGAGRPKGAKQAKPKKEYVCNFHVRCTSLEQKQKLEEYWQIIKNL